jgi:hypothetical protein
LPKRALPKFEFFSNEMAAVLRERTGAARLEIAFGMIRSARAMLENSLRLQHPGWSEEQVQLEASRRIAARGNE